MISLSDDEMTAILSAAKPLPVSARESFLLDCAAVLSSYPAEARGPGLVFRIASQMQRKHFRPPNLGSVGNYE